MRDRLNKKTQRPSAPIAGTAIIADESLVIDSRETTSPAELVERRLHQLLRSTTLPRCSSTFRVR